MNVVRVLPVILSYIVLGAHFLRGGELVPVAICLLLPFLLLVPRPWAARVLQTGLVLGLLEWARTLIVLVELRQSMGAPWLRLAIIFGAVILFTLWSVTLFQRPALRERYRLAGPPAERGPRRRGFLS